MAASPTTSGAAAPALPTTMLAAVLHGPGDLRLEQLPRPTAAAGEVVVRVHRCGICGSDLRSYGRGPSARYLVPGILGHEFVGTVVEVGEGVAGRSLGERVTAAPAIPCGACPACRRGDDNLCAELLDFGINIAGAMAEFVRIPARSVAAGAVVAVPAGLADAGAILGEPIGCCLRGLRRGGVGPGSVVVVIGDGPIGLTHAILARQLGAARVVCLGLNADRLAVVARTGAETLDALGRDPAVLLREALGAAGADTIVAAAPDPRALETALGAVRPGGSVVAFGGLAGDPTIAVDGNLVHYGELTLVGSFNCTTAQFREAIELAGRLDLAAFPSVTYPLARIGEAFEAAGAGSAFKAVVTMEQPS
jgi:L-iditol 2-dehydrogenase